MNLLRSKFLRIDQRFQFTFRGATGTTIGARTLIARE
jgi:hypothetical protein